MNFALVIDASSAMKTSMSDQSSAILARLRAELSPLRGLWHNMEADLFRLGITFIQDLRGRQADALAESYRALAGHPPDPILRPYFTALIAYAETGVATPWWRILRAEAQAET